MYDLIQQYFIDFEEASKITQISIGISLSITETALVFRLDCWVEDYNKERKAKDWILIEILDRFKSKGIGIPFPHLTVKQE